MKPAPPRTPAKPVRAGVLVRISDDKDEDEEGVGRQEDDCRAKADKLGWGVGEVYRENDTTAFKRRRVLLPSGKVKWRVFRPEFRRMLADIESGAIDGFIAYDLDRVARDPRDLEDLIDAVEMTQIPTDAVTGEVDLRTDQGIFMARMMVNVANKSSRDTSRRVKRKQQDLAAAGLPTGGGRRAYGYEPDGMTVRKDEARVLRQIAKWILGGDSLYTVVDKLDAKGIPTASGVLGWPPRSVHSVITKPRVAGLTTYQGEILGPAQWPAILDRDTWERVKLALDDRASGASDTELKRWLTGILLCGRCGVQLTGTPNAYGGRYWCNPKKSGGCAKVSINQPKVEDWVEMLLLSYLRRPDVLEVLRETTSATSSAHIRKELKDDEQQLKDAAQMWANKDIGMPEYMTMRRTIENRIQQWQQVLAATLPEAVRQITAGHVEETWEGYRPRQRREVARVVFPNGIRIMPATQSGFQGFDTARIVPVDWLPEEEWRRIGLAGDTGIAPGEGPSGTRRGGRRSGAEEAETEAVGGGA